jgi:hypothetical protein
MRTFKKSDIKNLSLSGAFSKPKRTVMISESQLDVIREYENGKVLRYEFESKVRKYMEQLQSNPCKPKYDSFFTSHDIPEDVLKNKMMDLGLITMSDKITEPEDANGKKHSVHTRKFTFNSGDFDNKMGQLYDHFFDNGTRTLNETDCGGVMGGGAGGFDTTSPGGATSTDSTGNYTYDVPFGGVQRRQVGTARKKKKKKTGDITKQETNTVDMSPALDRPKGKVAVNRVNEAIDEHKHLSDIADEEEEDGTIFGIKIEPNFERHGLPRQQRRIQQEKGS